MNESKRLVFGTGQKEGHTLVPEIVETGWGCFSTAQGGHLKPHAHRDAFEFCFILSGEVEWLTDNSSEVLRAGDVYITQPDELHWGRDSAMHPCTLHWLIVGSFGCGYDWHGLDRELATHLDACVRGIRAHRLRGTTRLRAAFENIIEEHHSDIQTREGLLLRRGNVRAALHGLLIELVRNCNHQYMGIEPNDIPNRLPDPVVKVIEILHSSEHDRESVVKACQSTGVAYDELNRQFVASLGASIPQYWLRERVRLARESLRDSDAKITDIANQFGFSSSQHFATVFRRVTGLTPSEYRGTFENSCNVAHAYATRRPSVNN